MVVPAGRRAAIYIRMSQDDQVNSPERQLNTCTTYCKKKGYVVVAVYKDEALRGHDETRPDFHRMMGDAAAKAFDVVVIDERERIHRGHHAFFAALVQAPLMRAGVLLEPVDLGRPLDWDNIGDLVLETVKSHQSHEETVKLSWRVTGELARKALAGPVHAGKPLYGYTRVNKGTDDEPNFSLVPHETESQVVRFIFDSYTGSGLSLNGIMKELRERCVPSPRGNPQWSRTQIREILRNRKYVGDWVYNVETAARHYQVSYVSKADGSREAVARRRTDVKKTARGTPIPTRNPESEWVVTPNTHVALVDRDVFERANAMLAGNRERKRPAPPRGPYALSRLLVCSHCGSFMVGDWDHYAEKRGHPPERCRFYICGGYSKYGPKYCRPFRLVEDQGLKLLVRVLEDYLSPARIDEIVEAGRKAVERRRGNQDLKRVEKELKSVTKKMEVATRRLYSEMPESVKQLITTDLVDMDRTAKTLAARAESLRQENPVEDIEKLVARLREYCWEIRSVMDKGDPAAAQLATRRVVSRVELRFRSVQKERRSNHYLEGGIGYFHTGEAMHFDATEIGKTKGKSLTDLSTTTTPSVQLGILKVPFGPAVCA